MNKIGYWRFFSIQMLIFIIISFVVACRESQTVLPSEPTKPGNGILIVNSDQSIEHYATIQQAFEAELSELNVKITEINLAGKMLETESFQKKVATINPYLIYIIGSKAYTQASVATFQNKPLIFSSIINWRRLNVDNNTYGISLELPTEMQLLMYSYLFPNLRTLGVLYSKRHNGQWFELAASQVKEVGLSLHGKDITAKNEVAPALQEILPKVDALWLISDPVVLYDTEQVAHIFAQAATLKKPIFAYDTLFSQYGSVLTVATDIPTMGRQAASLAQDILEQIPINKEERIQQPMGSHVTLNLKQVIEYEIKIDYTALSSVETIIQ
jgi:putative ABC transport system substrate-binding protein